MRSAQVYRGLLCAGSAIIAAACIGRGGFGSAHYTCGPFGPDFPITSISLPSYGEDPSVTGDELTLYFAMGPGAFDLYSTSRADLDSPFGGLVPVAGVNSSSDDADPFIAKDELTLLFSSTRPGGPGGSDLWMATRANNGVDFDPPQLLSISSSYVETDP